MAYDEFGGVLLEDDSDLPAGGGATVQGDIGLPGAGFRPASKTDRVFPASYAEDPGRDEFGGVIVEEAPAAAAPAPGNRARLTFYHNFEDEYGKKSAVANPRTGRNESQPGFTIAVDPEVIPYGSQVKIPALAKYSEKGDGVFVAHDTGSAVKARTASGGREPVIDVYLQGATKEGADRLRDHMANIFGTDPLDYEILSSPSQAGAQQQRDEFGGIVEKESKEPKGWLHSVANAIERGKLAGGLASEMRRDDGGRPDTVTSIQKLTGEYPASPEFREMMGAKDSIGFFKGFAKAPVKVLGELLAESLTSQIVAGGDIIPKDVAKGTVMGGGAGAVLGPGAIPGAAIGARAGFAVGMGETSFALESASKIVETLATEGVDVTDYEQMRRAFADPTLLERARTKATQKGLPVAAFDTASAMLAGGLFAKSATTVLGKVGHGAVELGVQALMGMGGELAGQLNAGEQVNTPSILAEGLGEFGPGSVEIAVGAMGREQTQPGVTTDEFGGLIIEDAPTGFGLGAEAQVPEVDPLASPLGAEAEVQTPAPQPQPEPVETSAPATPLPLSLEEQELIAREHSFPRGLLPYVERADFDEITTGRRSATSSPTQAVMVRAQRRARIAQLAPLGFTAEQAAAMSDRQAFAALQQAQEAIALREAADDPGSTDLEPALVGDENAPFSAQPALASIEIPDVPRLQTVADNVRQGWATAPWAMVVEDWASLPREEVPLGIRSKLARAAQEGSVYEAFYHNGKVYVLADGAAVIAARRGISTEQRVAQLIPHETVHHFRTIGALFPAEAQADLQGLTEFLLSKLTDADRRALKLPVYGFDTATPEGRLRLAEEALARYAETAQRPGWIGQAWAKLREMLRKWIPSLQWTDNDVMAMLEGLRRKPARLQTAAGPARFAAMPQDDAAALPNNDSSQASGSLARDLQTVLAGWDARGIKNDVHESKGIIYVSRIEVPRGQRNVGLGTAAMRELIQYADATNQTIALHPALDFGADSLSRLKSFYKRLGFIENKGKARDFRFRESMYREPSPDSRVPGAGTSFSAQPEEVANDPEKRRKFIDSVKANPNVAERVRNAVESMYQPITNQETLDAAKARINDLGVDRALAEVLATKDTNPPTALTNAMGIELLGRLQAMERFDEEAALAEHIAAQATSQGQAIQALAMMARLSPGGVDLYAQRVIQRAVKATNDPEVTKLQAEISRLKEELRKARHNHGTQAVLDIADAIKAAGLSPEKQVELQIKLRNAILMSATMPGDSLARVTQILITAGMDRPKAVRLAKKALEQFAKKQQAARDKLLRQMLAARNLMPPAEKLSESIVQRIERVLVNNPGSLWGRYREAAVKQLAAKLAEAPQRQGMPALQEFTDRVTRELMRQLPPEALGFRPDYSDEKPPAAAYLGEAIRNFDKYQDVWRAAQAYVQDKYRNDEFALERLDAFLGQILEQPFSQASLIRAMRETTSKLDVEIREILLRSAADKKVARDQIAAVIVREAGLSGPQAIQLRDAVWTEFDRQIGAAREAYAKGLFRNPVARIPKSQLEKWLEMNNAGVLDDDAFFGGIANKYGMPIFTRAHAQKIQELQRAYDRAPDGDFKLAAAARVMEAIHELVPVDFWTRVQAVRNMAMLLNPKTVMRNLGGNVMLWLDDAPADALAWGLDVATSLVTGVRTRKGLHMGARLAGLVAPLRDFRAGVDYARDQGRAHGLWRAGLEHMTAMARLTSRGVFQEGGLNTNARFVFSSRVMRGLENTLTLLLGVGDRAFHQSAFQSSIARQLKVSGETAPTREMIDAALLDANVAIFQDENVISRALGAMQRTLNLNAWGKDDRRFGLGSILVPFAQVPGSIAARSVTWSPIGFIHGILHAGKSLFRRGQFDQRKFTGLLARGALGTGLGYLGYYLFKLGILSALPEDDPDREAMRKESGLGQYRINVSELFRRMLSGDWHSKATQQEAAQDGDVIVNYDWLQPIAMPLAAGAQLAAVEAGRARELARGKTVADVSSIARAIGAGAQTIEAQPLVSSFTRFMRESTKEGTGVGGAVFNAFTKELASGFVPTMVRQLTALTDNTVREDRATPIAGLAADLPGFSQKFPPRYDVLGEMQERYQYGTNTVWNVMLNPAFVSRVKSDPVLRELDSLYERTGEPGVLLRQAGRTVTVNGKSLELTNEQRSQYQEITGKVSASVIRELIASPAYAALADDSKAQLVSSAIAGAATAGKIMVLGHRPEGNPDFWTVRGILHARALGFSAR